MPEDEGPRTVVKKGDNLRGEKVTVQCRDYHFSSRPINNTSRDKAQRGSLEGTVFCVIDKPIQSLRKKVQHID